MSRTRPTSSDAEGDRARTRTAPGISSIPDVVERQLCLGCGVCAFVQPELRMVDLLDHGRRPVLDSATPEAVDTTEALRHCPGAALAHEPDADPGSDAADPDLFASWGPVLEVWEGYAADHDIRFAASSGGAATALALHCMDAEKMHGVLHVRSRDDRPYLNETVLSTSRDELLAATGSRYAPASPCERLDLVEDAPAPCVFVGKPCDVAATASIRRQRPRLDERLGLTVAMFCAGTPTLRGTFEMLDVLGVGGPDDVTSLRYRGNGWPGRAEAHWRDDDGIDRSASLSYEESWGEILQRHRQWRCHVCADHTGEFADIAVGDPWYRAIPPGEPGRSLVLVRTERGRRILHAAMHSGALVLEPLPASRITDAQPNLLRTRGGVWGRVLASKLLRVPYPVYRNIPTFPAWWSVLTPKEKAQSVLGTVRRIVRRRLYRRAELGPSVPGTADAEERR